MGSERHTEHEVQRLNCSRKKKVYPLSMIKWLILQSWAGIKNWLTEGKRELEYKGKTEQSRGEKQLPQSLFSLRVSSYHLKINILFN